jgi:hypothetical protein
LTDGLELAPVLARLAAGDGVEYRVEAGGRIEAASFHDVEYASVRGGQEALGVPARQETVTVNAAGREATSSAGIRARLLRRNTEGTEVSVSLDRLPFFVDPSARKVLPFLPFQQTYNELKLAVTGLASELAYIRLGVFRSRSMSRGELERGVKLFDFWGGDAMKAAASVHGYTREKDQLYFRLWRVLGLGNGAAGVYNAVPHKVAIKCSPVLDRAREKLMAKPALTMRCAVAPADRAGEPLGDGDFIGHWSFLGPFPNPCTADKVGGEAAFTASVPALSSDWFVADLDVDGLGNNLGALFGARTDCFAYALTVLDSSMDQELELMLGSDDGFAVWLNGQPVGANLAVGRWVVADSDRFPVRLHKGRNVLMVKISQFAGEWGFCVRFRGLRAKMYALSPGEC